jgi:tetratricopeptide (TPR) repeat protein
MEVDPEFWAYATWFRLAIIIAGIVAILLGFLLFRLRIRASGDLKATLGDVQLNVNTTAPGTFFALLGTAIITTMVYQGNPSYERSSRDGEVIRVTKGPEWIEPAAGPLDADQTRSSAGNSIPNGFLAAYQRGLDLRSMGDDKAALAAFSASLSVKDATLQQAAGPLREVAEIYLEEGRPAEALSLARIATGIEEDNPACLNTLARVLLGQDDRGEDEIEEALAAVKHGLEISGENAELLHTQALISEAKGDLQQAISIMERAATQDAKFEEELQELKARHE